MARYFLTAAVAGQADRDQYRKYPAGTAIADTVGNAIAGDVVWAALCAAPNRANMAPLDAAASAVMGLPVTTLAAFASGSGDGGVGQNAGA